MVFEWDSEKAKRNKIKHGIGFKLATRVFEDEDRIESRDDEHSQDEERWQVIGKVENILFVVYTERGEKIRLISAREASPIEKEWYYGDGDLYFA
ncbi:MAG: BrnT family toxin [Selenomonadaceae bacterium]|nr:BrnT family toxin [Selenomonadaceae bacterium]